MLHYFEKFPLHMIPFTKEEASNIVFTFEEDKSIKLSYTAYINKTNKDNNLYYNYYNHKRYLNNKNGITWNHTTKNPLGFQCLIDDVNKVNVFKQSSFYKYDDSEEVIKKCTEEFYNNSY